MKALTVQSILAKSGRNEIVHLPLVINALDKVTTHSSTLTFPPRITPRQAAGDNRSFVTFDPGQPRNRIAQAFAAFRQSPM